jgi:hypothetical protein
MNNNTGRKMKYLIGLLLTLDFPNGVASAAI